MSFKYHVNRICLLYTRGLILLACICYLQNFQHMKTLFKSIFPPVWKRPRLCYSNPVKSNMKQIRYHNKEPEPQMAPADNLKICSLNTPNKDFAHAQH